MTYKQNYNNNESEIFPFTLISKLTFNDKETGTLSLSLSFNIMSYLFFFSGRVVCIPIIFFDRIHAIYILIYTRFI